MDTVTQTEPLTWRLSGDEPGDLDHFYCCNPDVAYCGVDLTQVPESEVDEDGPLMCVVCKEMDDNLDWTCKFCGF